MTDDAPFRWMFAVILVAVFSLSAHFRHRARQSGETIARTREGGTVLMTRLLFAAALYLPMIAYVIDPASMAWASLPLPRWLRWVGAGAGLAAVPAVYWVLASIGRNISETVLTKGDHRLVTGTGPYRWVRHPLYAVAAIAFIALGVLAASWYLIAMAVLAVVGVLVLVIPKEEDELVKKFGVEYRRYQARTGRLLPRVR